MDPFMQNISKTIEEEVERRVNERVTALLQYMADHYDIPVKTLVRVMNSNGVKSTQCMAMTKNGSKRCKNSSKHNGFCHIHQHMYVQKKHKSPEIIRHNHTLPPLWVKGCPACDKGKPLRDLVDCFGKGDD